MDNDEVEIVISAEATPSEDQSVRACTDGDSVRGRSAEKKPRIAKRSASESAKVCFSTYFLLCIFVLIGCIFLVH